MRFNSLTFLLFASLFFFFWPIFRRLRNRGLLFLIIASSFAYGWEEWWFPIVLLSTGAVDYIAGARMANLPKERRMPWLLLSVGLNLSVLIVFKYFAFFAVNLNTLFATTGLGFAIPAFRLTLPIGISFYTFQALSYTISLYRGQIAPAKGPLPFFASLSLFPHLVAGPVVRPQDMLPQFEAMSPPHRDMVWVGLRLIAQGFFKKAVLADNLAPAVNAAFGSHSMPVSVAYWWTAAVLFAMQVYFDFSGYTDIARGLAKCMGFEFPLNFRNPYSSTSFRELWTRYHMSLSTWFRDYVYFSLPGSRKPGWLTYRNLWITMLISGLWHGANWTFVVWGGLNALFVSVERLTGWPETLQKLPGGRYLCMAIVFMLWSWSIVFFRAENLGQAWSITQHMVDLRHLNPRTVAAFGLLPLLTLAFSLLREAWFAVKLEERFVGSVRYAMWIDPAVMGAYIASSIFLRGPANAFIYFQF